MALLYEERQNDLFIWLIGLLFLQVQSKKISDTKVKEKESDRFSAFITSQEVSPGLISEIEVSPKSPSPPHPTS